MATIVRMVPGERIEARTFFTAADTVTAYVMKIRSEDDALTIYHIWCEQAPGTDFPEAGVGSLYVNTTAGAVKLSIKTDATTWTVVGTQS